MNTEFTSYFKLREPFYCYYPLHLDPYGSGCSHDCVYCFQKDQLCFRNKKVEATKSRLATSWRPQAPSVSPINKIRKMFADVFDHSQAFDSSYINMIKNRIQHKEKVNDKDINLYNRYCLSQRLPLRVGGVTDPFQDIERKQHVTYEIIKLLNQYNYPAQVVTKNTLVAEDKYLDLFKQKRENYYIQITITTSDDKLSKCLEPNAPSPSERFNALKKLNDNGIFTAVRINPLFPKEIYKATGESFEEFIKRIKKAGTSTVIVGGLRVMSKNEDYGPVATAEFFNNGLANDERFKGIDIKKLLVKDGGTYYIPREELLSHYTKIKDICNKNAVNFTVCYDSNSNADDMEFVKLWHCAEDCCNGYGNVPNFKTTHKIICNGD